MDFSLGFCSVELTGENETITPELLQAISEVVGAGRNLAAEDLYVRSMFVTSDKINSQGGRFDRTGLEKLCELIPGAPVMIGHDKSKLPIGRCFKAEIVERNGEPWVKAMFYWLKSTTGSDDLRKNIDGGIYTECSLGFNFRLPQCSICSGDVRKCSHVPGHEYRNISSGSMEKCHYLYRDVNSVNEISLVYRGAVPGTSITSQILQEHSQFASIDSVLVIKADEILPNMSEFSVEPVYHGIPFVFYREMGTFHQARLTDGVALIR